MRRAPVAEPDDRIEQRRELLRLAEDPEDLILQGGPFVFEFFHFLVGSGLLEFLESPDSVVEVVMLGDEGIEGLVFEAHPLECLVKLGELVVDIVVF